MFGAVSDLVSDAGLGIPVDHVGTFGALAGTGFNQLQASAPGTAAYSTVLERGYALHELTFALLFLVLIAVPFRRRQRWAWWTAWLPMIANLGYTFTFGIHDPTILYRSLIADIARAIVIPEGGGPVNPLFLILIFLLGVSRLFLGAPWQGVEVQDRPGGPTAKRP